MMYIVTGSIVLYNNDPEIIKGAMFSFLNTKLSLKLFVICLIAISLLGLASSECNLCDFNL